MFPPGANFGKKIKYATHAKRKTQQGKR